MTDPTDLFAARRAMARSSRHKKTWTLLLTGATALAAGSGCSMMEGGVPLNSGESAAAAPAAPAAPTPPATTAVTQGTTSTGVSAADVMFQSTEPFADPPAAVNVFGELDGFGPAAFEAGGKAGFQQHTFLDEGFDADPTVSPDGRWLLFSSTRHSNHADLYLQRVDGLAVTQISSDPADDAFPRFSPDGKQIAFASNRSGNWDIFIMDVEGKNVRQLTRESAQELHPSFSPDGTRIVFSSLNPRSGQWELWTVDVNTLERRMIGYGLFPEWSPRTDRDVIAFQRARQRGTHWFSAWTLELVDDEATNITEIAYSTNAAIVAPTWSPDGKRLAFCTITDPQSAAVTDAHSRNPAAAHPRSANQDIWIVKADGTERTRLTDGRGMNSTPTWSKDGRIYFVSDRAGNDSVWSVAATKAKNDATARVPTLPDDRQPTASVPMGESH